MIPNPLKEKGLGTDQFVNYRLSNDLAAVLLKTNLERSQESSVLNTTPYFVVTIYV